MYFPESLGTSCLSRRNHVEALRYGSNCRLDIFTPSFSHVYLRGVAPVARHLSLIVCDAGHALNALFSILGSENLGAPKTRTQRQNMYGHHLIS